MRGDLSVSQRRHLSRLAPMRTGGSLYQKNEFLPYLESGRWSFSWVSYFAVSGSRAEQGKQDWVVESCETSEPVPEFRDIFWGKACYEFPTPLRSGHRRSLILSFVFSHV